MFFFWLVSFYFLKKCHDVVSYGPIAHCRVVTDSKTGKSRGYAFVEYEHESDLKDAYKQADGKKVEGKRIVVDVERGRTVKSWLPRVRFISIACLFWAPPRTCLVEHNTSIYLLTREI